MPFKDPQKRAAAQRRKFDVWREMIDGHAAHSTCRHCGLPIYSLDETRHAPLEPYWFHFVDPKALGIRPMGKNDPVYDLVRRCDTALRHRYVPEAYETHAGTMDGLDPRVGAYDDLVSLCEQKIVALPDRAVAEPHSD